MKRRGSDAGPHRAEATALSVLQRFRIIIRAAQRHSQGIERVAGVSGAQLWMMKELSEAPGLRIGELAQRLSIHQSTASNALDKLEATGYVRRDRSGADQRVVRVSLTEAGLAVLGKAPDPARGVLPEALRRMDPAALARLQGELDLLLGQIEELDEGFGMQPLPFTE